VVVLDPRNGDVLALVSAPHYDPNAFSRTLSDEEWKQVMTDPSKVLVDRAVAGIYAPGSVFKPVVAVAALENHCATPATSFTCGGVFEMSGLSMKCWKKSGHGTVDLIEGLEQSCNVYFIHLGMQCGNEKIYHMAAALGFGEKTGIELPKEVAGILSNDTWKRRVYHDGWRPGDTANLSIGQGMLAVTPLQVAVATAAIANGGKVFKPRLVLHPASQGGGPGRPASRSHEAVVGRRLDGDVVRDLKLSPETVRTVKKGMFNVVNAETGTGKRARLGDVAVAGKTGTAEYGKRGEGKKYTWMTAFAPVDNPTHVVVILIEDGESGGKTVAPRMKTLVAGIFGVPEAHTEAAPYPEGELDW
jgi:penicillin-binding protein 2